MCGIAGIARSDGQAVDRRHLLAMAGSLSHRGPDDQQVYCHGPVGLVHTRLAIVDIAHGAQPLLLGNNLALVANGEIYNAPALRRSLPDVAFNTRSDCEPVLGLYAKFGTGAAQQLRGMYAFAINDPDNGAMVLARDPVGIKPLYYAETDIGLVFASDIAAVLSTSLVERRIDPDPVHQLLQCQYSFGRPTPIAGIRRLLPGETLGLQAGRIAERQRAYALPDLGPADWTEEQSLERFDTAIRDSVTAHLQSDVPLGLFFSGGIDSSILLALMAQAGMRSLRTFTCHFEGAVNSDERELARSLATAAGAIHHVVEVRDADFVDLLPRVAAALDDPTADYAALATYKLGQEATPYVKAVLCGEGGDELFAGYGRYRVAAQWWRFLRRRKIGGGIMDRLGILRTPSQGWSAALDNEVAPLPEETSRLRKAQARDFAAWVPNDLMTKVDRCLMAHGVEGRVPFLDPAVIDCAWRTPDAHKIHGRLGKWILRRWLQRHFPAVPSQARKQGFTAPLSRWIGSHGRRLGPQVAALPVIQELCNIDAVKQLFDNANRHTVKAAYLLLFFALWYRVHIESCDPNGSIFDVLGA